MKKMSLLLVLLLVFSGCSFTEDSYIEESKEAIKGVSSQFESMNEILNESSTIEDTIVAVEESIVVIDNSINDLEEIMYLSDQELDDVYYVIIIDFISVLSSLKMLLIDFVDNLNSYVGSSIGEVQNEMIYLEMENSLKNLQNDVEILYFSFMNNEMVEQADYLFRYFNERFFDKIFF